MYVYICFFILFNFTYICWIEQYKKQISTKNAISTSQIVSFIICSICPIEIFDCCYMLLSKLIKLYRLWNKTETIVFAWIGQPVMSTIFVAVCAYFTYTGSVQYDISNKRNIKVILSAMKVLQGIIMICNRMC